jgi:hypothetical protein
MTFKATIKLMDDESGLLAKTVLTEFYSDTDEFVKDVWKLADKTASIFGSEYYGFRLLVTFDLDLTYTTTPINPQAELPLESV